MTRHTAEFVVGIADCRVTTDAAASIVTYALGSCVAVAIHDPVARVGGLLHVMLPESPRDARKAAVNPHMFADTGVPSLLRQAWDAGAEPGRLDVWLAGGARVIDDPGIFNIGERNCLMVRKALSKAGVTVRAEALGGREFRTVRLDMTSGRCLMRTSCGPECDLGVS